MRDRLRMQAVQSPIIRWSQSSSENIRNISLGQGVVNYGRRSRPLIRSVVSCLIRKPQV